MEVLISTVYDVSLYLGILGFLLFLFSFISGMRYIKPKDRIKWHKRIGIIGTIAMSIHACVMLFFRYLLQYFL